jgi:hypothetical protein
MGNAVKGQTSFEVEGKTLVLEYTPNGFCELEDATGKATMAFLSDLDRAAQSEKLAFRDVRLLFWAGLVEHQPDLTPKDAGRLIKAVGGLVPAMDLLQTAIAMALPDAPEGEAGQNPPKATA